MYGRKINMKFLYLVACCMILSSHNFYTASEIDTQSSRLEADWLTADKDGNSKEIEEKIIPIITTSPINNGNQNSLNFQEDANETPDKKIINDIDDMVASIYTTWSSIWSSLTNILIDDSDDI